MDSFADRMTARGPTLAGDRDTWTGSLHIVDLPSPDAAREFVEQEPYNRAGLFDSHLVRRFENLLGRTMWGFSGDPVESRFLVFAHPDGEAEKHHPPATQPRSTAPHRERLIVFGELSTLDEGAPAGFLVALQAPTSEAVHALLEEALIVPPEPSELEIYDWEFGGRR